MPTNPSEASFIIPLPGGRVARVPRSVLESYVAVGAETHHPMHDDDRGRHHAAADTASLTFSPSEHDGAWHADYELGLCTYLDEAGNPQTGVIWHRHPTEEEFAEPYRP